ncbi:MAG: hypothetical protein GX861_02420 [Tenericutes bacterium]|jgi:hypothetical protein|nr:hypothetical protein [Mycoplasmatota bacterium]
MNKELLNKEIIQLDIDPSIIKKLNSNDINIIDELWCFKRKELKKIGLNDNEIKQVIIKLQLKGMDLNRRKYNRN